VVRDDEYTNEFPVYDVCGDDDLGTFYDFTDSLCAFIPEFEYDED